MAYETIMVPLDGSEFAEQALPVAEDLARRNGADLELVRVHPGLPPGPSGRVPEVLARADGEVAERERRNLESVAAGVRDRGLDVRVTLAEGAVVDELCRRAAAAADLVVMATHGRGRLTRLWLGSTADGLVRCCPCPVLLIRPREDGDRGGIDKGHVLVPLDGSNLAESALDPAVALARAVEGRITLLHVVVPIMNPGFSLAEFPEGVDHSTVEPMEADAEEYLSGIADRLRDEGMEVETVVTRYPDAAAAILECSEERAVDVVAMATRGQGGLRRLLLGSVADKVIRGSEEPILVVNPEQE